MESADRGLDKCDIIVLSYQISELVYIAVGQQEFAASDVPNVPTSHGLSVLQSRFQLYRFDSSATSTSARASQLDDLEMLTSQPSRPLGSMHSRQRSSRVDNFDNQCSDFRQMLMSRAYADCSRDSDMVSVSTEFLTDNIDRILQADVSLPFPLRKSRTILDMY